TGSITAASLLDFRNSSQRERTRHRRLDLQQAHRRRDDAAVARRAGHAAAGARPARASLRADRPPAEAWMVAGGGRLAPFITLASALAARGTKATLFYGARRADELHCVELFEALGVSVVLATEDGSRGVLGRITVPLGSALAARPLGSPVKLFVCGPTPMMRACARLAAEHGRACDVSLEQVMGCGLGGCYSCVVRAKGADGGKPHHTRTGVDGPVFDAIRVAWETLET